MASCETAASAFWHYSEWLFAPLSSFPYRPRHGQEEYIFQRVADYLLKVGALIESGPPSFIKGVFQQQLLKQIIVCFPWGQELSALKYRGQLASLAWLAHMLALMVGQFLSRGERSEVPLSDLALGALVPWLVAFLNELRCMVELAAKDGPWGREDVHDAEVSAQILFYHLHEMTLLNEIMRSPQGPSFEVAARKLLSCISSPDAKVQGGALVSNIHYLKVQRGASRKETLNDFKGIQGLLQRLQEGSGSSRSEGLVQLLFEINGGTVPALQNVLMHCEVVPCLTQVFQAELEATGEVEVEAGRLTRILELLSLFMGLVDMSDSASLRAKVDFDAVGACLLDNGDRALQRLGQNTRYFWEVLVLSYNSGTVLQVRRSELIRVVVRGLESDAPERWAGVLGWHFLTVLLGIIPSLRGSGFGVQTREAGESEACYRTKYGVEFRARHLPVETSGMGIEQEGVRIARMVFRQFRQFRTSHELHGGYPSSAALVLELLCRNDPELLREHVLPKLGQLVESLELAFNESASSFGEPGASRSPVQAIDDEQRAALCSALTGLVAQLLALDESSSWVIKELARSKGVDLCKRVLRCKRVFGTTFPPAKSGGSSAGEERSMEQELETLVQDIWEKVASAFDLKACSNTVR